MMGFDAFYNEKLKEKNSSEIAAEIQKLQNEIESLKKEIESKNDPKKMMMDHSRQQQISFNRLYVEYAKDVLRESGGTLGLSKAEKRAEAIDRSIPQLEELFFSLSDEKEGTRTTRVRFCDTYMHFEQKHGLTPGSCDERRIEYPLNKEEYMRAFQRLHIGEWKARYENTTASKGKGRTWKLELDFGNSYEKVSFSGLDAYPYNFFYFCTLIGVVFC